MYQQGLWNPRFQTCTLPAFSDLSYNPRQNPGHKMEKCRSEEQIPPFAPQVNVVDICNVDKIMQQVS